MKGPLITTRQVGWEGGISDNPRAARLFRGTFLLSQYIKTAHFDIFSNIGRLTPYRDLLADTNDGSTSTGMKQYKVLDFVYASGSAKEYGLGQNGSGQTKIVYKADATTGNWTLPSSSEGNGAVQNGCFFEFQDYLWGFQGTNQIFKYGLLSGTPSITNTASGGTVASTITSVANGIIAADGNAYLAYNNVIVRIAPGLTITDSAKTVPSNYKINAICNYGNYMAIMAAPKSGFNGTSKVFIWNLSSDLFQDSVDWGEGEGRILETIEGMLVGVTDRYLNNSTGAGRGSMIIQTYSGGSPQVVKEIFTKALTGKSIPLTRVVKNNRLFFAAKIMTNTAGTTYNEGLWSFGRKAAGYPFTLALDIIDENINTSGIQAFGIAGSYFFVAHSADGSIDKTSASETYSFTSILETQIVNNGTSTNDERLYCVRISFPSLVSGQSLTLKYKVDDTESTAWTTIGTFSTVGALLKTFLNIEATAATFQSGVEYKFQVLTTGGLQITGFEVEMENFIAP